MSERLPIEIPPELAKDRAVRLMLTQWRNLHLRHKECRKRVFWGKAKASMVEKKRRREKWLVLARILEIEFTLIRQLARKTHHADIWMSKREDAPESMWHSLLRRYHLNRRNARNLRGDNNTKRFAAIIARRAAIVKEIRALERAWIVALYKEAHPTGLIPKPVPLHATELRPRKIKQAIRTLSQEVA